MSARLIVFDLDGTLVNSRADLAHAANAAVTSLGRPPLPVDEVQAHIGNGSRELMRRMLGPAHQDQLDLALAAYFACYEANLCVHTRVYPGVDALLRALDVPAVVLTNKPGRLARPLCDALGITARFEVVWGEGDAPARKPDPQGALSLCARFGVAPAEARFVGDSHVDAATARNAAIPFIGVTWGFGTPDEMRAEGATDFADSADDLRRMLGA